MDADLIRASGGHCLLWAVRNDHSHMASQLLLNGVDPNHKDRNGATALAVAIKKDNEPLARTLLESGANPNLEDRIGRTALSWALFQQSEELVLLLLKHKVDLSMNITGFWRRWKKEGRDEYFILEEDWSRRKSPLELAVCSSENVIAAFSQYAGWSPANYEASLLQAVRTRKVAAIRLLLERSLDKDMIYNPLREAILDKQDDTVKILLNDGLGQHYIVDEDGTKLMFTAACTGLKDVVKFMLDKGADCNCRLTNNIKKWKTGSGLFRPDCVPYGVQPASVIDRRTIRTRSDSQSIT
ncbi:ankyrin [Aspergillus campestris IBT 28561]|uniref:Ankyrin n=1 Tax=Aspergillus campestris (strain IBT 28561) TaxID=1392248 RepID=A0A2I1DAU9_ASPC2|nr:ankyrin [Aspergillus campestris IBT 28561]PKY07007.1 ankyrin [Aspergillus campestris IBT 28561]